MKEIRIHGRGGQGAVTAARMLSSAFVNEGKCAASFPMYGFERRGAPVQAFTRVDDRPIRERTQVYTPDCMVVIDPTLLNVPSIFSGIKPDGILVANSPSFFDVPSIQNVRSAGLVNATKIAIEEIGQNIPNTCLLGAFAATTGWLALDSILRCLSDYLSGDVLRRNVRACERGFSEVKISEWQ